MIIKTTDGKIRDEFAGELFDTYDLVSGSEFPERIHFFAARQLKKLMTNMSEPGWLPGTTAMRISRLHIEGFNEGSIPFFILPSVFAYSICELVIGQKPMYSAALEQMVTRVRSQIGDETGYQCIRHTTSFTMYADLMDDRVKEVGKPHCIDVVPSQPVRLDLVSDPSPREWNKTWQRHQGGQIRMRAKLKGVFRKAMA